MKRQTFFKTLAGIPLFGWLAPKAKAAIVPPQHPHPDALEKRPTSDGKPWPQTFDAREWGYMFVDYVKHNPEIATDPETMHGWFANAIMLGHDTAGWKHDELLKKAVEMRKVQGGTGNWDYDPYMHGMYNGMEYTESLIAGREPDFREPPEKWLS